MDDTTRAMGAFYGAKVADKDLRRYRGKGPIPSTRALIEMLKAQRVEGATLLDIGGGVGAIAHELLDAGLAHATCVDASASYLAAAREESERRGNGARVTYLHGDFVEVAAEVPPADIVTLDRVINVYPGWERLIELAAERATRLYGLVYPRDTPFVRFVVAGMNGVNWRGPVRASIPAPATIDRITGDNGLSVHSSARVGPAWQVELYQRT